MPLHSIMRYRIIEPERSSGALLLCGMLLVVALATHDVVEGDVWFDLRLGAEILSGNFQNTNLFSFSETSRPWINTHWLYDLLLILATRIGGIQLAVIIKSILFVFTFLLLWIASVGGERPRLTAIVLSLGVLAGADRLELRSEMTSYFWIAFYLAVLEMARREGRSALLWLLVPAQLLWANMHGYWIAGPLLLIATTLGAWAANLKLPFEWRDALSWKSNARSLLTIVTIICILIPIVNPYGFKGVIFPLILSRYLRRGYFLRELIAESVSPFTEWGMIRDDLLTVYIAFIALTIFSCIVNFKRLNLVRVTLSGLFLLSSLQARRVIPLFAIVTAPLVVENLGRFQLPQRLRAAVSVIVGLCLLAVAGWAVEGGLWMKNERQIRFGLKHSPYHTPGGASDFVERHRPSGPVLNTLDAGGYLAYCFRPDFRVFIDGRLQAYSDEIFREYILALQSADGWNKLDNRFHFGWVILNQSTMMDQNLITLLNKSAEWKLAYMDCVSIVFVKRASNQAVPELILPRDLAAVPSPPLDRPWGLISLGFAFELLGLPGEAQKQYRRVMELFPTNPIAPDLSGKLLAAEGKQREAIETFARAVHADPDYMPAMYDLGTAYLLSGYPTEAKKWLEHAVSHSPGYLEARLNLAAAYYRIGDRNAAIKQYREILERDPSNAGALQGLRYLQGTNQ